MCNNFKPFSMGQAARNCLFLTIALFAGVSGAPSHASAPKELPVLGDTLSGVVSADKEYQIGQAWLRALRGQVRPISDPLLNDYFERLLYDLASHSELEQRKLSFVLINSPAINAFAVPGGVVGANAGLLLNAETEDQLSAVLAHELAHLSQRHFARALERAKRTQWVSMAALLASVVVASTSGNPDAGMAAIATTQAASMDSQLRFSRHNEQEADRIGMKTMVKADRNPHAMPEFFERLYKTTKFLGKAPPEFLLTHPVTQSRITDSLHRANHYPPSQSKPALDFTLMKARTEASYARNNKALIKQLKAILPSQKAEEQIGTRYGLVCALMGAHQYQEARKTLMPLLDRDPHNVTYNTTLLEIWLASGDYEQAVKQARHALAFSPGNYPLNIRYAEALLRQGKAEQAITTLNDLRYASHNKPMVWSLLAESYGQLGDTVAVHRARAEYLFLNGRTEEALKQLRYALPLAKSNYQTVARIKERINTIRHYKKEVQL